MTIGEVLSKIDDSIEVANSQIKAAKEGRHPDQTFQQVATNVIMQAQWECVLMVLRN